MESRVSIRFPTAQNETSPKLYRLALVYPEHTMTDSLDEFRNTGSLADGQQFSEAQLVPVRIMDVKEPLTPRGIPGRFGL
jgi:hypothetical protein